MGNVKGGKSGDENSPMNELWFPYFLGFYFCVYVRACVSPCVFVCAE